MKIQITRSGNTFTADCVDFPGSPPVGRGATPEAAMAELFHCILFSSTHGGFATPGGEKSWTRFLKREDGFSVEANYEVPELGLNELRRTIDLCAAGAQHLHLQHNQIPTPESAQREQSAKELIDHLMQIQRSAARETVNVRARNTPDDPNQTLIRGQLAIELVRKIVLNEDGKHGIRLKGTAGSLVGGTAKLSMETVEAMETVARNLAGKEHRTDQEVMSDEGTAIVQECQRRASVYVQDNSFLSARPDAALLIENAALIGASIVLERQQREILSALSAAPRAVQQEGSGAVVAITKVLSDLRHARESGIADQGKREGESIDGLTDEEVATRESGKPSDAYVDHMANTVRPSSSGGNIGTDPLAILTELRAALAPTWVGSPEGRSYLVKLDDAISTVRQSTITGMMTELRGPKQPIQDDKPVDFAGVRRGSIVWSPYDDHKVEVVGITGTGIVFKHPSKGECAIRFDQMTPQQRDLLRTRTSR